MVDVSYNEEGKEIMELIDPHTMHLSPDKESIKLIRSMRGVYSWEIKLILDSEDSEKDIKRLAQIDSSLLNKWGGE